MNILNSEKMANDQSVIDDEIQQSSSLNQNESKQNIYLQGTDNSNTYNLFENQCDIYASKNSSESRINASNKIKVNRLVNYEWEQRYSNGNLIAVHKSGQYFGYSLRIENAGKVRVFHRRLNEKVLIKSFKSRVIDLSFAHTDQHILLASIEETGLQIHKITLDSNSKIQTELILTLNNNLKTEKPASITDRVIWCMYVPETGDDQSAESESAAKLFAYCRKGRVDIFNLDLLLQHYDCSKPLETSDLAHGHLVIDLNLSGTVLTACFSPDGTALATASSNGDVNFYKFLNPIQTGEKSGEDGTQQKFPMSPDCLKVWRPHDGKPITSLYFLDDHKNSSADVEFWSFILTGADYNREIKLWSCFNWTCLQTLSFFASPMDDSVSSSNPSKPAITTLPCIKTAIDLTSKYLIMSDITRKCFYVLHLSLDNTNYTCRCTAISEYILAYPALSFAIIEAHQIKAKKYNQLNSINSANADDLTNTESSADLLNTSLSSSNSLNPSSSVPQLTNEQEHLINVIRLYCIQTKQLQEMQIFLSGDQNISSYNSACSPPPLMPISTATSLNQSNSLLQQLLPNHNSKKDAEEKKPPQENRFAEDSAIIQIVTPPIGASGYSGPILMTPDAFINSPTTRKSSEPNQKLDILQSFLNSSTNSGPSQSTNNLLSSRASSLTQVTNPVQEIKHHNSLTKLNGSQKLLNKVRTDSSSSSSSSSSSEMDQEDKEIAALSSSNKSLASKKQTKLTETELLLNKVSIEESTLEIKEETKSGNNWPNPPELNTDMDIKSLLIQMNQTLQKQQEEMDSLKKSLSRGHKINLDEQKVGLALQQSLATALLPKLEKVIKDI